MPIDLEHLKKLSELDKLESAPLSVLQTAAEGEMATAIVKVREPNYVPPKVRVRAQIHPTLFTAEFPVAVLGELQSDPKVQSVALSRPLKLIE